MRAVIQTEYGLPDVLQLEEVPDPICGSNQVILRVMVSSINALDWHLMTGTPYLVRPTSGFVREMGPFLVGMVTMVLTLVGLTATGATMNPFKVGQLKKFPREQRKIRLD